MVEGELGLSEIVVAFHATVIELDSFYAIIYTSVPRLKLEACHGPVGEDLGVRGVLLYAV